MGKRIAIIGSGISGLTCGYLLHKKHDITLYEAEDYIGGHTATKEVDVEGKTYAIDTGFIVYNDWTYPNFIKLMDQLHVQSQPTEMSFSVKNIAQNIEYNGNTLNSLFAQRRNILRPKFWSIVRDILRFNKLCNASVQQNEDHGQISLYEFIVANNFSQAFTYNYILPMCAAIWSTSLADIKSFPFAFFLKFFHNHGLLNIIDRPQWRTLVGGSKQYIAPLTEDFKDKIRLSSPVKSVSKVGDKYAVVTDQNAAEMFDEVIFACHSDQALGMLTEPSSQQTDILGAIRYGTNEVVLHTDSSVLPKRKLAWASWNYLITGKPDEQQAPIALTYNMNILQCLSSATTFCVTLNSSQNIDTQKILGRYQYAHPQFTPAAIQAQTRRGEISAVDGLHFCGAYWHNGFHEDGVRSALDVCLVFGETL
jgi:predicted NAD/FAD-binding protein